MNALVKRLAMVTAITASAVVALPTTAALAAPTTGGNITVQVFQDFNANGVRNTTGDTTNPAIDALVPGATVTATCLTNNGADGVNGTGDSETYSAPVTATASGAGTYTFTATPGSPCRIEVTSLPVGHQAGPLGTDNGGLVQFAAAGATVKVGVNRPSEFCQNNPKLATTCMVAGNAPTTVKNVRGVETLTPPTGFNSDTVLYPTTVIGNVTSTGTTYGIGYHQSTQRIFASAYLRRKAAFGPGGAGAIYVMSSTGAASSPTVYVRLQDLFSGAAGTDPRPASPAATYWNGDAAAVPAVGKVGLGDIEVSADGSTLYAVALGDRKLYAIPTSGAVTTATVVGYQIPTTMANCTGAVRPFGLGVNPVTGLLHVGAVCSAQPGGSASNLRAYVWTFSAGAFTLVLDRPLVRSDSSSGMVWKPWDDTDRAATWTWNPQPMLTDITFQSDNMVIGVRDRYGDQTPGNDLTSSESPWPRGGGDLIRACRLADGTYDLEHPTTGYCGRAGGEYYTQDTSGDTSADSSQGSVLQIPGWSGVYDTAYDAVSRNAAGQINNNYNTGGLQYHNNTTRLQTANADIYEGVLEFFGKSSGMGDLIALCDRAPIEIGNRVWVDANSNGQQDAGEPALAGVPVTLTIGAQTFTSTTDTNGVYLFSSDSRPTGSRPTTTSGVYNIAALTPGVSFSVSVPTTSTYNSLSYAVTSADLGSDTTDSDANATGTTGSKVAGAAGVNNHTFDFGYAPPIDLAIAKTVAPGGPYGPGSAVTFTLTVTSNGPSTAAAGFTVTDLLPTGLTFTGVTTPAAGSGYTCAAPAGQQVTCTSDHALAPASSDTLTVTALIADGVAGGTTLTNVTWVQPKSGDKPETNPMSPTPPTSTTNTSTTPTNNDAHAPVTTNLVYDLALINTMPAGQTASLNNNLVFDVTVANQGNVTSGNYTITNAIPAGTTFVSATDGGVLSADGRTITWNLTGLTANTTRTVTYTTKVTTVQSTYRNWAEISTDSEADEDSTPDTTTGRDTTNPNDLVVNHNDITIDVRADDEDDNDFEQINDASPIDLMIAKTVTSTGVYGPGSTVTFGLTVTNNGPATAVAGYTVNDLLPVGLTFTGVTTPAAGSGYTCAAPIGQQVTCTSNHTLAVGASDTLTITAKVAAGLAGGTSLTNVTWVVPAAGERAETNPMSATPPTSATNTSTTPTNNDSHASITTATVYDLALINTMPTGQTAALNNNLVFDVTVANQGNVTSGNYTIVNAIPAGTTFVSATDGGVLSADGRTITWNLTGLAVNTTRTVTYTTKVTTVQSTYRNWAEISTDSGADEDSTPDTTTGRDTTNPNDLVVNHNDITIDVRADDEDDNDFEQINDTTPIDLAIDKTVTSAGPYTTGATVTYRLVVTSNGPAIAAAGFTVTDLLPTGLTYTGVTTPAAGTGYTCAAPVGQQVTCTSNHALAVGASDTLTITAKVGAVTAAQTLYNVTWVVPVTGDKPETNPMSPTPPTTSTNTSTTPTNNDSRAPITTATYDLALVKSLAGTQTALLGGQVTWTVTIANQGTLAAGQFTVTDTLPAGMTFVSATAAGSHNNGIVTWTIADLAPGATTSMTVTVRIDQRFPRYRNWAEISADSGPDEDSTPDANTGSGVTNPNDLVVNHNDISIDVRADDEDDNDYEDVVDSTVYDLALINTMPAGQTASLNNNLVFDVTVANQGNVTSGNYTIVNAIPAGTTFVSATDGGVLSADGRTITWTLTGLTANTTRTVTYTTKVTTVQSTYRNWAEISTDSEADEDSTPDTTTGRDTTNPNDLVVNHNDITIDVRADDEDDNDYEQINDTTPIDLAIDKTVTSAGPYTTGATVMYRLAVVNNGPATAMTGFTVTDLLPTGLTFTGVTTPAAGSGYTCAAPIGQQVTCTSNHTLAVGTTDTLTITAKVGAVTAAQTLYNVTWVAPAVGERTETNPMSATPPTSGTNTSTTPTNNDSRAPITTAVYDLALINTMTAGQTAALNANVTFDVTIANQGTTAAGALTITDALPTGTTFVSATNGGTLSADGRTVAWNVADLAAGATTTVSVTLKVTSIQSEYRNWAEISTDSGPDEDSTPDATTGRDTTNPNDLVVNHNDITIDVRADDEDDNDYELIADTTPIDLAIDKTVTSAGPYDIGSTVTFRLAVVNNGPATAKAGFTVTDLLPAGLTFTGVTTPASGAGYTCAAPAGGQVTCTSNHTLAVGTTDTLTITAKVAAGVAAGTTLTNVTWVLPAAGEKTETNPMSATTPTSTTNTSTTPTNNDSRASVTTVAIYDLALINTLPAGQTALVGGNVVFDVTVANQGNVASGAFVITDALPAGTTFVSATDAGTHTNGTVTWNLADLAASGVRTVSVTVRIDSEQASYRNWAEISTDGGADEDSAPDTNTGRDTTNPNDLVVNHNDITIDVRTDDEDDNDYEQIVDSTVYDLALIKTVAAGQKALLNGNVMWNITVANQGNVTSGAFTITDSLPAGMQFVSTSDGGTHANGIVTWNLTNLGAGAQRVVTVTTKVVTRNDNYYNWAEISTDSGNDEDSTPDTNTGRDITTPNDLVLNHDDITVDQIVGDEDDNDVASIADSTEYDLALINTLPAGQTALVGGLIRFDVTVANQGNVDSGEITVTNTIPTGTTFVGATGTGAWSGRTVTWTIPNLAPGETVTLTVTVRIVTEQPSYRNWAEISNDNDIDEDSTPDTITGTDETNPNDDVVNHNDITIDNPAGDQDDNDFETIADSTDYDLALIKTLAANQKAILGGTVTYIITVKNQGNVPSGAYTVVDRLATGTAFVSATDAGASVGALTTWKLPALAPGATKAVSITVKVTSIQAKYRNWAEIVTDAGNDEDSAPDATTGADATNPNDTVVNHNDISKDTVAGDEDDNDFEDIANGTIYDLALIKTAPAKQVTTLGSIVTFQITVANQGNIASGAFTITDTLPSGTAFISATDGATVKGRIVTWKIANLAPGARKTVTVKVGLLEDALRYRNWAEISADSGPDRDSTPDLDTGNDGTPGNDLVVNHNDITKDKVAGDEDDNDFEDLLPAKTVVPETA